MLSLTDVISERESKESRFSTTSWLMKIGMPAPWELAMFEEPPLNLLKLGE